MVLNEEDSYIIYLYFFFSSLLRTRLRWTWSSMRKTHILYICIFFLQFIANQTEMDVVLNEEDSSYLAHQHPQWELVDNRARARLSLKKYECCQQPFTLITISTKLRRRPQFYRYLTVVPAALMGLLVPVIYLVPSNSHGKTTFGELGHKSGISKGNLK